MRLDQAQSVSQHQQDKQGHGKADSDRQRFDCASIFSPVVDQEKQS